MSQIISTSSFRKIMYFHLMFISEEGQKSLFSTIFKIASRRVKLQGVTKNVQNWRKRITSNNRVY